MKKRLELQKLQGAIEAILFASGEPVSIERIAQVLSLDRQTCGKLVQRVVDDFNEKNLGIQIIKLEEEFQMCTCSEFADNVRTALDLRKNTPLSQAALEVLSIIAYNQPVTKAFIEQIRGVDCSGTLGNLSAKGLVEERGRLELPGRPLLYGTTAAFLRCLGISSLEELPPLPQKRTEEELKEVTDEEK